MDETTSTQFQLARFVFLYSGERQLKLSPSSFAMDGAGAVSEATTTIRMDDASRMPEK